MCLSAFVFDLSNPLQFLFMGPLCVMGSVIDRRKDSLQTDQPIAFKG